MAILLVLILLSLASPGHAASHLIAWDAFNLPSADVGFRVERCTKRRGECVMQFVTNLPKSTRQYLDQGLNKNAVYGYQVKSMTSPYSNVVWTE